MNSNQQQPQQNFPDAITIPTATVSRSRISSSAEVSYVAGTATIVRSEFREIRTLDFQDGDRAVRYYLDIPDGIPYDTDTVIEMNGRRMMIRIPSAVRPGERVVIVAPME